MSILCALPYTECVWVIKLFIRVFYGIRLFRSLAFRKLVRPAFKRCPVRIISGSIGHQFADGRCTPHSRQIVPASAIFFTYIYKITHAVSQKNRIFITKYFAHQQSLFKKIFARSCALCIRLSLFLII